MDVGGDLTVNRLGFGAMRITGPGIWGEPPSRDQAIATLRRVVEQFQKDSGIPASFVSAEFLDPKPTQLQIAFSIWALRPMSGT